MLFTKFGNGSLFVDDLPLLTTKKTTMKKTIYRNALGFLLISFLFMACNKETVDNGAKINGQSNEMSLKTSSQSGINENIQASNAFGKDFNNSLSKAGISNAMLPTLNIYALTRLPIFNALNAAIQKTGLTTTLSTPGLNATVFAPTDAAFAQLPAPFNNAANINSITDPNQIDFLKNVLLYHVVGGKVKSFDIAEGRSSATTLKPAGTSNDNTIYFSKGYGLLAINGSTLVLVPNVPASNGIVHIVNKVLMPPTSTIADIAVANPVFSSLVAALTTTSLVGIFQAPGDYTVFAPTNDAFSALPAPYDNATDIAAITDQTQIDALANILKYHVLASRYFSLDLGVADPITTLAQAPNNQILGIRAINKAYVRGNMNTSYATGFPANVLATNGVVHVMDQVLLP